MDPAACDKLLTVHKKRELWELATKSESNCTKFPEDAEETGQTQAFLSVQSVSEGLQRTSPLFTLHWRASVRRQEAPSLSAV